jgi:hypothetical protein
VYLFFEQMFMDFNSPTDWDVAICYEATLIGSILNMNPCPRTNKGPYEFFNSPLDISGQEINTTLVFIWQVGKMALKYRLDVVKS